MTIKSNVVAVFSALAFSFLLSACGQSAQATLGATSTEAIATEIPTNVPTALPANTPEPTPIPGTLVLPLDTLGNSIPWLPLDVDKRPTTSYYAFNLGKPPFNNVLVRQAFVLAIDRQSIVDLADDWFENLRSATTLTPSETLGRDLVNSVGLSYDPERAKELLEEAGYTDITSFPPVTLLVSTRGEAYPGAYSRIADLITQMWQENLGIAVEVEVHGNFGNYIGILEVGDFDIYQLAWGADVNDPDAFLNTLFHSSGDLNFGHFASVQFDSLVSRAAGGSDPATRQLLYIDAERILTEELAGVMPLYHSYFYQGQ